MVLGERWGGGLHGGYLEAQCPFRCAGFQMFAAIEFKITSFTSLWLHCLFWATFERERDWLRKGLDCFYGNFSIVGILMSWFWWCMKWFVIIYYFMENKTAVYLLKGSCFRIINVNRKIGCCVFVLHLQSPVRGSSVQRSVVPMIAV